MSRRFLIKLYRIGEHEITLNVIFAGKPKTKQHQVFQRMLR
jgi:hypothetical protein